MRHITDREILAKCIDIVPGEKITKKKDWNSIENTSVHLETFLLDRSSEYSAEEVHAPYANLRCFTESVDGTHSEMNGFAWRVFIAVFAEENDRPDIFHFNHVSTAVKWISTVEERFVFWKDQLRKTDFKTLEMALERKASLKPVPAEV